ncbi:claudin-11-like isoform X1 [Gadus macrocephalus]|uniref:claudin-11-like isoform X1 n=1 Tax=Gadus macrocephalus TaxID=80720 RepID=UPI0028CB465E|nr:claudin-11-like isoform X1 [Gadus macrocephalus]
MACPQVGGFLMGCLGWLCILVATSTNNWVIMCKYGMNACKKSEESNIKGPWAECSVSSAHYECQPLTQILELPAYIHTTRALMITASTLALLAVVLLLMSLPCISLGEPPKAKSRRAVLGGLCFLFVGKRGQRHNATRTHRRTRLQSTHLAHTWKEYTHANTRTL